MMRRCGAMSMCLVCVFVSAAAVAAEEEAFPGEEQRAFTVDVTGGVWLPRLDGKVRKGSSANVRNIDLGSQFDLNDLEAAPNVELTLHIGDRWHVGGQWFDFSTDNTGPFNGNGDVDFGSLTLSDGDQINASFDIASYAVEVGYDIISSYETSVPRASSGVRMSAFAVARYVDVEQSVEQIGIGREDADAEWFSVLFGLDLNVRLEPEDGLPLGHALELEGGGAVGPAFGGDGGYIWQVRAGFRWEITPNIAGYVGYRLLELDVEDDSYELDGGLQGLLLGGSIRF
jgi:hypothetical protein